jgi:hypothetical protein
MTCILCCESGIWCLFSPCIRDGEIWILDPRSGINMPGSAKVDFKKITFL